uniref:Uncharacterized protein n=1 Tax=mine drainage metagenome TaxID=410659 RepID=E6Q044_9ZZZZ
MFFVAFLESVGFGPGNGVNGQGIAQTDIAQAHSAMSDNKRLDVTGGNWSMSGGWFGGGWSGLVGFRCGGNALTVVLCVDKRGENAKPEA